MNCIIWMMFSQIGMCWQSSSPRFIHVKAIDLIIGIPSHRATSCIELNMHQEPAVVHCDKSDSLTSNPDLFAIFCQPHFYYTYVYSTTFLFPICHLFTRQSTFAAAFTLISTPCTTKTLGDYLFLTEQRIKQQSTP